VNYVTPLSFLKHFTCLPGITREQMKTISLNREMNATFKQVQLLPALTSEMFVGRGDLKMFCPVCARVAPRRESRAVAPRTPAWQLPRPRVDESKAERALFAVLALSAFFCVGSALATMIELTPNWPTFQTWVVRLLG
jgi:hypothetical protein